MHPDLIHLNGLDELDRLLSTSSERAVLFFKHSFTCGTSAEALDELMAHVQASDHECPVAVVTVQTHRHLSNELTMRLGVRHETPQALLVRDGRVVWSASHFRVTAESVQHAIKTHG